MNPWLLAALGGGAFLLLRGMAGQPRDGNPYQPLPSTLPNLPTTLNNTYLMAMQNPSRSVNLRAAEILQPHRPDLAQQLRQRANDPRVCHLP